MGAEIAILSAILFMVFFVQPANISGTLDGVTAATLPMPNSDAYTTCLNNAFTNEELETCERLK